MKKGRHRRFEEAAPSSARASLPSRNSWTRRTPSRARSAGPTPATTTLPGAWSRRTKTKSSGPDVPASAPPPALLRSRTPLRELHPHPAQRRARRPRRPRQDHARRRDAARHRDVRAPTRQLVDRVMDSNDQERERGITILAKAASVTWKGVKINLVDTPGHADFGGEVERALTMVDGVLLLVDAAEGPLPQTRYVLSKALAARPAGRRRAQQGRPRATPAPTRCSTRSTSCSSTSTPTTTTSSSRSSRPSPARAGRSPGVGMPGADDDLAAAARHHPRRRSRRRSAIPTAPLQALVTNLDASDYLGRLAIGRVVDGTLRKGETGRAARRGGRRGPAAAHAHASPSCMAFEGVGRDRGRRAGRRRPVRRRRLPRGRDRRHPRRRRPPRGRCPG